MTHQHKLLQAISNDFRTFAVHFFKCVNPGTTFAENWHIDAMAVEVERLIAGDNRQLLVTMPPRCLKSYMISVALPAFLMGHDPAVKIIVVSYSEKLAEDLSAATQRIIESATYKMLFPGTVLARRTRRELKTSVGGRRFSTTIGGAITGIGGGWLIVDDPLNGPNAYSDALRGQANTFFDETLSTRGDTPKSTRFVVVMQRLHEDDLAGHIMEQGGWVQLKLQARATQDAVIDIGGGRQHHVLSGDLLHAERLDDAILVRRLRQMGTAAFEASYQQNPLPAAGNQIKREWLHRYDLPLDHGDGIVVQSWDTASKTGVANDHSVCTTWLLKDNSSYLLNVWRGRLDFPALKNRVVDLYHEYGTTHLLIEDASSGTGLIQELRATTPFSIIPRACKLEKKARVDAISGALESGRVMFPREATWLAEFERELLAFPGGRHDDQVDSVTQYVRWAIERGTSSFFEADFGFDNQIDTETIAHHILNIRRFG